MTAPRLQSRWIVGPGYDLTFFVGSVAFSFALYGFHRLFSLISPVEAATGFFTFLVHTALFDAPHVLQTFSRTHFDGAERARHRLQIVYGLPLFVAAGLAGVLLGWQQQLLVFGTFYGGWHIYRQYSAFLGLYQGARPAERDLDHWAEHGLLLAIFLASMARVIYPGWPTAESFWILFGLYLTRQLQLCVTGRPIHLQRLLFMCCVIPAYILIVLVLKIPGLLYVSMNSCCHTVQYQGWLMHYQSKRFPEKPGLWRYWLASSLVFGLFIAVLQGFYSGHVNLGWTAAPERWVYLAYMPYHMILLFHYYIDGVIWRFGEAPELRPVLARSGP